MLLELKGVAKDYGAGAIIDDVSLMLDRGQSLAVSAPSGAGKSTLLSIAGLLLAPSAGALLLDGENMANASDEARSRARAEKVGFLFQHTQLVGTLRAIENVTVAAGFVHDPALKMADAEADGRARALLESLGIGERMYYYPHQLSVGQKRRVATARALLLKPPLIIADEPTNDLDAENAKIVVNALFERVEKGEAALLFATHDPELAARADEVLYLK